MGKKNVYPDKKTLNLVFKDRPPNYYRNLSLSFLAAIIVIGIFTKFAVIDRLNAARALTYQAASERMRYEQLVRDNAVYPEVRAEYEKYFTQVSDEKILADCMAAIRLMEQTLMASSAVKSAALSDNVLTVVLTGSDLERVSNIVRKLYENPLVSSVSVSSAGTTAEGADFSVSVIITLVSEGGDEK